MYEFFFTDFLYRGLRRNQVSVEENERIARKGSHSSTRECQVNQYIHTGK